MNSGVWWELFHSLEYLNYLVEEAAEAGETADEELLSLAKQVVAETEPRIDNFWNWVVDQPSTVFGSDEVYREVLELARYYTIFPRHR